MFTVPLAFIGVVFGLFAFDKTLSVPALMGILILTGIVVNNAIVMIDYINWLKKRGIEFGEAIVEGAAVTGLLIGSHTGGPKNISLLFPYLFDGIHKYLVKLLIIRDGLFQY